MATNQTQSDPSRASQERQVIGPIIACGLAVGLVVWCVWFITHLPWLVLPEQTGAIAVLIAWILAAICFARAGRAGDGLDWVRWGAMGLVSSLAGLPIFGTRVKEQAEGLTALDRPSTLLMVLGFLGVGLAMGMLGGAMARLMPPVQPARPRDWLARFAWVTVATAAPLLFIGGLVTSTNSGMAVPDWPTTYGSNMFLYPLGAGTRPDVFFEHSHRLFGTLVGLATLTLTIWTLARERRRGVVILAIAALVLVILQGVLGGVRVLQGSTDPERDRRLLAAAHGVLAQLTLGTLVALATTLSPKFRAAVIAGTLSLPRARLLRMGMNGALHGGIFQLILGAMYRHLRHPHILYTHIAFAIVVLVMGMIAGSAASATQGEAGLARVLRRCGVWIMGVVIVQFTLGWLAFLAGGSDLKAQNAAQALVRTAHQANGALLLGLAVAIFVWGKRALREAGPR